MSATLVDLARPDKPETVAVLSEAFRAYPVMRYVLGPEGPGYDERLRALMGFFVESRLTRGLPALGLRSGGALAAVALVVSPDPPAWPPELQACYDALRDSVGEAGLARLQRYADVGEPLRPKIVHHFLGLIGVRRAMQGRGLGRALLEAVSDLAARHPTSRGVCLDTEDPRNVEIYRHVGYDVVGEAVVEGDLRTWCMFRPNRAATPGS